MRCRVNGAVVNKIGTSQIALSAHEARTRFLVAAETYKFAPRTIIGEFIEIEERDGAELLPAPIAKTLPHVTARNPVFDVTPPEYVDLIMTEEGAIPPRWPTSSSATTSGGRLGTSRCLQADLHEVPDRGRVLMKTANSCGTSESSIWKQ